MEQLASEFSAYIGHLYDYWKTNSLWTWRWWLAVFLSVAPWVLWGIVRKKDSTLRLLSAASFAASVAIFFDTAGVVAGFWHHPVKIAPLPLFSCLFPWDYSVIPVSVMLLLQLMPKWRPPAKAAAYAAAGAFIAYPAATWLGYVAGKRWLLPALFAFLYVLYLLAHKIACKTRAEKI